MRYEYLKVPMLVRSDNCLAWLKDMGADGWRIALCENGYFIMERERSPEANPETKEMPNE